MTGHDRGPSGERQGQGRGVAGPVRIGWFVFAALAVLTIVEYAIAVRVDANLPAVAVIGLFKAGFIVYYFMHVVRAWRREAGH